MKNIFRIIVMLLFILTVTNSTDLNAQSEWKFNAALYGWLASISGDVGIINQDIPVTASVSDILENLKFTAGGHFEARNPHVSLIGDVFFVGLGADSEIKHDIGDTSITNTGTVNLDEWIIEAGAGYRTSKNFELIVAGRYYSLNTEMLIDGEQMGSVGKSWGDIFFGARYYDHFGENWFANARVDIGTGGSTFAWYAALGGGYVFSDLFSLALTYNVLNLDYETGSGAEYFKFDASTYGLGIAAMFTF